MIVSLSDEAKADAREAADWYIDQDAWSAAEALQQEITRALARLALSPGLGTPASEGTRILPIHVFPISLVYRVEGDLLRVIAVAGQLRRPGYWARRR